MPNYEVNYDDKRFAEVESNEKQALSELEQTYGGMIDETDSYFEAQIDASKEWADKQAQLQQEQTDFAIEEIEQQKDQAKKDYLKEQSGAYVDWQKQSNQYGANAEQMAASGLKGTGYSESSQVSMYNTYQNRVATARESYSLAVQNYNNAITEARLQNNSILAEIAYNALQQQLELSLQGFQYKNALVSDLSNKKLETKQFYSNQWQNVLQQINTENALAEEVRQYNASLEEEKRQFDETLAEEKRQYDESQTGSGVGNIFGWSETTGSGTPEGGVSESGKSGATALLDSQIGTKNKKAGENGFSSVYKKTDYYDGYLPQFTVNSGANYGYFSNGYQPKGIIGHGKLTKTGDTFDLATETLDGKAVTVNQNIWKASDGTYWYWDGRVMMYTQTSLQ